MTSALPLLALLLFPPPQDDAQEPGTLTLHDVRVELQDGGEVLAHRGVLHVPLVRDDANSATIQVEFHRFRSAPEHGERPPVFVLNGGPGFPGLSGPLRRKGFYENNLQQLVALTDVVVVGQRGIGSSTPNTTCKAPLRRDLAVETTAEQEVAAIEKACLECRVHWEEQGLDVSGFNVLEAAADVIAIADALEYPKITLKGGSFGSHWSMAIMRGYPDRVARAVLNGMEGPDHTYDMPEFVLGALKRIAAAAETSEALGEHLPEEGLITAFEQVIADVEAEPFVHTVGKANVRFDARVVRDMALGYTRSTSSRDGMRTWPADVIRLARGDFDVAARTLVQRNFFPGFPTASFFVLDCGSGISPKRRERLLADPAAAIVGPLGAFYEAACPVWEVDLGDAFRGDFETPIPTVIVHGTWDTSTPFENAVELQPCFPNSRFVVVEGGSHGALGEAIRHSDTFRAELEEFIASGDMEGLPELVELPPIDWVVPEE